jgi:hypothetical protein
MCVGGGLVLRLNNADLALPRTQFIPPLKHAGFLAQIRSNSRKMYTPSRIPSLLCLGTSGECAERDGLAAAAVDDGVREDSSGRADNLQEIVCSTDID